MHPLIKIVLAFSILMILTSGIYPRCLEYDDSFKKHVLKAREFVQKGKDKKAIAKYKGHLKCWNDEEIAIELGKLYESQNKYYLAGLVYEETGLTEKFNELEEKKIVSKTFENLSKQRSEKYLKSYKNKKIIAATLTVFGSVAIITGLSLFIHDKAGGTNSLAAQYSLMLGGLSFIGIGISTDLSSIYAYNRSKTFLRISDSYSGDNGTTPVEYYVFSGAEVQAKKTSASAFKKHGTALMILSIPMFAISIYGFYDTYKTFKSDPEESDNFNPTGLFHFLQIETLIPAIITFAGGLSMISKASKWEIQSKKPAVLTLNRISPIINPVSKTYGLALGFSF